MGSALLDRDLTTDLDRSLTTDQCLLLTAFIAVNADAIPQDPVNIDDEVEEEDRDDIDEEDEEYCIRCHAHALGKTIHTGTIRTNSARACQIKCEQWNYSHPVGPNCNYFSWRDRDFKTKWMKRRRCYLLQ